MNLLKSFKHDSAIVAHALSFSLLQTIYSDEDFKFKVSTSSSLTTGLKDVPETTAHRSLFIRMNLMLVAHEA
jgi:hypothetical protein